MDLNTIRTSLYGLSDLVASRANSAYPIGALGLVMDVSNLIRACRCSQQAVADVRAESGSGYRKSAAYRQVTAPLPWRKRMVEIEIALLTGRAQAQPLIHRQGQNSEHMVRVL